MKQYKDITAWQRLASWFFIVMLFMSIGFKSLHVHNLADGNVPVACVDGGDEQLSQHMGDDCPICKFVLPVAEKPVIQNSVDCSFYSENIYIIYQEMPLVARYISLNTHSPPAIA